MSTLRIYGCSYAAEYDYSQDSWPKLLSKSLGIPLINQAVGGSSTEFSMLNICRDISNNVIADDDIICFVMTTAGRVNLRYVTDNVPNKASNYVHDVPDNYRDTWYCDNKSFIEWYLVNQDYRLIDINQQSYIHSLINYAYAKPSVKFILLKNLPFREKLPYAMPKNFLMPDVYLGHISRNEIYDFYSNDEYRGNMIGFDPRSNHLSEPNIKILVDLITQSIQELDVNNFKHEYFHSKILNKKINLNQYLDYVNLGILPKNDSTIRKLSG
jgi:hypothetical protein